GSLVKLDPTTGLPIGPPTTNILVRLTEISLSYPEPGELLTASFVPISITHPYQHQIEVGRHRKANGPTRLKPKSAKNLPLDSRSSQTARKIPSSKPFTAFLEHASEVSRAS